MSSTLTHAVSASWIAVTAAHVLPDETGYILAALISASALDLDHVFFVIRDRAMYRRLGYRGQLHQARSLFHEMFGLGLAGLAAALLFLLDPKLALVVFIAFAIHVAEDWVMGKSYPLTPVDNTEVRFFSLTFRQKILVDAVVLLVFGGLWILYLAGRL